MAAAAPQHLCLHRGKGGEDAKDGLFLDQKDSIPLFPLTKPIGATSQQQRLQFDTTVWPLNFSQQVLSFWQWPIETQEAYDCFYFAMYCMNMKQTKRVIVMGDQMATSEFIAPTKPSFLPIQLVAHDEQNSHVIIHVGPNQYLSKMGFGARYTVLSWKEVIERFPYPKVIPYVLVDFCQWCGKQASKLLRCGKCQQVLYCSQECQREHWNSPEKQNHKTECANKFRFPTATEMNALKQKNEQRKVDLAKQNEEDQKKYSQEPITRTSKEILERINTLILAPNRDDRQIQELIKHLPYDIAKPYLDPRFNSATWIHLLCKRTPLISAIAKHITIAAVGASIDVCQELMWLLGEKDYQEWNMIKEKNPSQAARLLAIRKLYSL